MTLKDFYKVNFSVVTTYIVFDQLGEYKEIFTCDLTVPAKNSKKLLNYIKREADVTRISPHPYTLGVIEVYLEV